jgi:hypothetical protein
MKRRNYNTAERIRGTLQGRTLCQFDAVIMLAIGRKQPAAAVRNQLA